MSGDTPKSKVGPNMSNYHRGMVVIANLEPTIGSEQKGHARPCLIVSSNIANRHLPVIVICPLTSKDKGRFLVGPVSIPAGIAGLEQDSFVLVFQIRTVDKSRVVSELGFVPEEIMDRVSNSLRAVLDLD